MSTIKVGDKVVLRCYTFARFELDRLKYII
ncbi:hypothetical protein Mithridates_00126 [Acinetobacter phage Mithridates]|nr:hypothetical protein Mithridates_00126 [Acinetobacter phage Mithridates]